MLHLLLENANILEDKKMSNSFQLKIVGTTLNEIPLIAVKSYPTRIFDYKNQIRIAYSDIRNGEKNVLGVGYNPDGIKNSPDPQIIFFVKGTYHREYLGYYKQDPFKWKSWIEIVMDLKSLNQLIYTLRKLRRDLKNEN